MRGGRQGSWARGYLSGDAPGRRGRAPGWAAAEAAAWGEWVREQPKRPTPRDGPGQHHLPERRQREARPAQHGRQRVVRQQRQRVRRPAHRQRERGRRVDVQPVAHLHAQRAVEAQQEQEQRLAHVRRLPVRLQTPALGQDVVPAQQLQHAAPGGQVARLPLLRRALARVQPHAQPRVPEDEQDEPLPARHAGQHVERRDAPHLDLPVGARGHQVPEHLPVPEPGAARLDVRVHPVKLEERLPVTLALQHALDVHQEPDGRAVQHAQQLQPLLPPAHAEEPQPAQRLHRARVGEERRERVVRHRAAPGRRPRPVRVQERLPA